MNPRTVKLLIIKAHSFADLQESNSFRARVGVFTSFDYKPAA